MSTSRVVGDVLSADGVCVARKLCLCTRSRQTHAFGSVGAFPKARVPCTHMIRFVDFHGAESIELKSVHQYPAK